MSQGQGLEHCWGRERMEHQGLCCPAELWPDFKVFGVIKVLALPCPHLPQEIPGLLGLVDVTLVQGPRVPSCITESLVELELNHEADKVPGGATEG